MKTISIAISLLFACIALHAQQLPGLVSECDFCMCSQGISPLEMGGTGMRYDIRYTELSHEFRNGERVANTSNAVATYLTNQFALNYAIASRAIVSAILPVARKSEHAADPDGTVHAITNDGLGDISLLARYNVLSDRTCGSACIASITGGVKLANGSTGLRDGEMPADPDVQLGTGTTDLLIGAGYLRGFEDWSIGANVLAGIRGFGPGASGHLYGNNLNYDVTARYRISNAWSHSSDIPVFAALGVRGEWRGYEVQDGQRIDNSGGDVTYVAPGLQVFFADRIALDATVWLPFVHALNGDQIGETIKILAGIQAGF
ncbi:MAG: hypothetical protein Q8922_10080 [Bacteroidota bacterium]|nr:hypothetical protein [Bacteroidota bacterium]MDP4232401.1 hypothetical protein [Bacteroidota bacterium]MDP4241538.1 hypothetical protein [Bacteroidota bacterium]MDP4288272.1 hypothetical protein [Bacteroidota bacterium]